MYFNTMFQRTVIDSLLYERRKKIDMIAACSNNIQPNDIDNFIDAITNCINSIQLDDLPLDTLLEQTETNINLILDGTFRGFTNDDVNAVQKIKESFQYFKKRFPDYKKDRAERERDLKNKFSSKHDLARKIINHLNWDDQDFISRYKTYINFKYDIEEPLAAITLRKWENQLTKPSDYRRGCKFKFLVHAIGTDANDALKQAKSRPIISTSLITDEFQGTYRKSEFGFVYQPNLKNVLLICSSDCYVNDFYFCEDRINAEFFSLTSIPLGPNKYLEYNSIKTCKTMHIEEIENDSKEYQNSGIENISGHELYNEIVLLNDPSTNPIAVFLLETEDTREWSVGQAEELATRLKLPLLRI
ncbi:hypothetical protein B1A99_24865 [Cohnella sp. CIP 111063]|uniref:hypothetical protein n=1 Tax=unclassified Cohnella TaxID=2636738 RepID=UPI000B8C63EA|nr:MULTISPECIES: hypothetical protein [unclassified Cohnella]OXS55015.1 hypothetical protein B1A99_24865 [Cohnella sp. CIP 111063]PRX65149.1 hypothetical protein B0G52_118100 [Cohnella sp. SGD-V74]